MVLVVDEADDSVALCNDHWQGGNALYRVILIDACIILKERKMCVSEENLWNHLSFGPTIQMPSLSRST
jgi:hypothetical protein